MNVNLYNYYMNYKKNISTNIKMLRLSQNMSQAELANNLNLSKAAISLYELGERTPSTDTIIEISRLFDVEPGVLFSNHKDKKSTKLISVDGLSNSEINAIATIINNLKKK